MDKMILLLVVLMTVGCSSNSYQSQTPNTAGAERALVDEDFLINSGNYPRLIDLYKQQLKKNDQSETRIKLAKAYLDTQDNESALFTIAPVITQPNAIAESFYLQGLAQFNLGQTESAERSLEIAVNKDADNAAFINLLGATQAELGQLKLARESFNRARSLLYDDVVIKNNLALVDMLEGNYQGAVTSLMPIYRADPEGADEQLKANLAIIAAKLGSFETLRLLYGSQYSDRELFGIFQGLRASKYIPTVTVPEKTDNRLLGKSSKTGEIQWQKNQSIQSAVTSDASPVIEPDQNNVGTTQIIKQVDLVERQAMQDQVQTNLPFPSEAPLHASLPGQENNSGAAMMAAPERASEELKTGSQKIATVMPPSTQENRQAFEDLVGIQRRYSNVAPPPSLQRSGSVAKEVYDQDYPEASHSSHSIAFPVLKGAGGTTFDEIDQVEPTSEGTSLDVQWPLPASTLKPLPSDASVQTTPLEISLAPSDKMDVKLQSAKNHTILQHDEAPSKKKWRFVPLEQYSILPTDGFTIPVAQFRHAGQLIDVQ